LCPKAYRDIGFSIRLPMNGSGLAAQGALDFDRFPHFAPLLEASQAYAALSGYRFSREAFDGVPATSAHGDVPIVGAERANDAGPLLAAKIKAAPMVHDFAGRLLAGDSGLVEELSQSSEIVWAESVRNGMIATLPSLDLWPPASMPQGVDAEDCDFENLAVALPVFAQRLYNDERRRERDAETVGGVTQAQRRARTAFFIVDFAEGFGASPPTMPEAYRNRFDTFAALVDDFQSSEAHRGPQGLVGKAPHGAFRERVGHVVAEAEDWWADNHEAALKTASAAALVGGAAARLAVQMSPIGLAASVGITAAAWGIRRHRGSCKAEEPAELAPWAAGWLQDEQACAAPINSSGRS